MARGVEILGYHGIIRSPLEIPDWCFLDERAFREQMGYLRRNVDVIPLREVPARIRVGAVVDRPTVAITLDDGFRNNYDVAFPILREERLPAAIFVTTGLIGTADTVWFCRLNFALAATRRTELEWKGLQFDLSGVEERARASRVMQTQLKVFAHGELLSEVDGIVRALGEDPRRPIEEDSPFRMLDRRAIEAMVASGLIDVGAHTCSHAILSLLSRDAREVEIGGSLAEVEKLTGHPCELFAYPNGHRRDYDEGSIRFLRSAGVLAAVTWIEGQNGETTPELELRRRGIGPEVSLQEFQALFEDR
jgi:peptidoglycan/xylan/chitin deacetylase (PgdA/CDA1 family)